MFGAALKDLFSLDLRSLALFRIALGAMLIADALYRVMDFRAFHTDEGVLPASALNAVSSLSPCLWWSDPYGAVLCLLLVGGAGLVIISGRGTRPALLVAWFALVALRYLAPVRGS